MFSKPVFKESYRKERLRTNCSASGDVEDDGCSWTNSVNVGSGTGRIRDHRWICRHPQNQSLFTHCPCLDLVSSDDILSTCPWSSFLLPPLQRLSFNITELLKSPVPSHDADCDTMPLLFSSCLKVICDDSALGGGGGRRSREEESPHVWLLFLILCFWNVNFHHLKSQPEHLHVDYSRSLLVNHISHGSDCRLSSLRRFILNYGSFVNGCSRSRFFRIPPHPHFSISLKTLSERNWQHELKVEHHSSPCFYRNHSSMPYEVWSEHTWGLPVHIFLFPHTHTHDVWRRGVWPCVCSFPLSLFQSFQLESSTCWFHVRKPCALTLITCACAHIFCCLGRFPCAHVASVYTWYVCSRISPPGFSANRSNQ